MTLTQGLASRCVQFVIRKKSVCSQFVCHEMHECDAREHVNRIRFYSSIALHTAKSVDVWLMQCLRGVAMTYLQDACLYMEYKQMNILHSTVQSTESQLHDCIHSIEYWIQCHTTYADLIFMIVQTSADPILHMRTKPYINKDEKYA